MKKPIVILIMVTAAFMPYFIGFMYLDGLLSFFGTSVHEVEFSEYQIYVAAFAAIYRWLFADWSVDYVIFVSILIAAILCFVWIYSEYLSKVNIPYLGKGLSMPMKIMRSMFARPKLILSLYTLFYIVALIICYKIVPSVGYNKARDLISSRMGFSFSYADPDYVVNCEDCSCCSNSLADVLVFVSSDHYYVYRNTGINRSLIRLRKDAVSFTQQILFTPHLEVGP